MAEDQVGLHVGGQMNFIVFGIPQEFVDGADDEERVNEMLEVFVDRT